MPTTRDVLSTPRSKAPEEFEVTCLDCGGPLLPVPDRVVPVFVHARHAAWAADPHTAFPISLPGVHVPGAWQQLGMVDATDLP